MGYSLEELEVQAGDIVTAGTTQYEVVDCSNLVHITTGVVYTDYGIWGRIFNLVSRKGKPKKKGYAKWISSKEEVV